MSEMGSDEPYDPASALNDALIAFTGCIGEAIPDICSYGLTVGQSYVPFLPDESDGCDEDDELCSQLWVRVAGSSTQYQEQSFGGECGGIVTLEIEVGILRCFVIPEGGEAPTATEVLVGATQAMSDMQAIYCAAMSCEVWASIESGQWEPLGPTGGQYGGIWTFTVEV